MGLLKHYLRLELKTLLKNNIRFNVIGQRDRLEPDIRDELEAAEARTAGNTGMLFNIALSYGGRAEIVDAARRAIRERHRSRRARRDDVRVVPLHGRPARSRSADSHERRDARQQLPALADRLRRDLGDRRALAGLPRAATCSRPSSTIRSATAGTAPFRRRPSAPGRREPASALRQLFRMLRIVSAAVLLALVVTTIWFLPLWADGAARDRRPRSSPAAKLAGIASSAGRRRARRLRRPGVGRALSSAFVVRRRSR